MSKEITDLFPDIDTNIVNLQKQNDYQRLVSSKTAGYVYNLKFPYCETDFILSQSMTSEDLGFVDIIYFSQIQEINDDVLEAIHNSDISNFESLLPEEEEIINQIANNYFKAEYNSEFVRLNDIQKVFYSNLDLDSKKKTDRLIAYKLSQLYKTKQDAAEKYIDILTDELGVTNTEDISKIFSEMELNAIERLLSYKTAMYIHKLSVVYLSPDYYLKQQMNIENLSILDMLYASKVYAYQEPELLEAIQNSDEKQFYLLSNSDKEFIERQVELFLFSDENEAYIKVTPQDSLWYSQLSLEEKYKIDRLLMYKLNSRLNPPKTVLSTEDYLVSDLLYIEELSASGKVISPSEYYVYERITSYMLAQKIYNIDLPFLENDYLLKLKLDIDDLSIIDLMYKSKLIALQDSSIIDSLKLLDIQRFQTATYDNKAFINSLVQNYSTSETADLFINLNDDDTTFYGLLSIKQKYLQDRLIVMKFKSILNAEMVSVQLVETLNNDELNLNAITDESNIITLTETNAYERILAFKLASYIYSIEIPFNDIDFFLNEKLTYDELSILDMMFAIKTFSLEENLGVDSIIEADKIISENINAEQKTLIDEIVNSYSSINEIQSFISLNPKTKTTYENLSVEQKFQTDRLVAAKLSEIIKEKEKIQEVENSLVTDDLSITIYEISENTEVINETDYTAYEKILSFKIANYIHNIDLEFVESDYSIYENMSIDDKSIVDMMFEMRIYSVEDSSIRVLLQKTDEQNYFNLTSDHKKLVDYIVEAYIKNSGITGYIDLQDEFFQLYANLEIKDKNQIDRIISSKLRNLMYKSTFSDLNYEKDSLALNISDISNISDIITQEDISKYEKILSFKVANYIYSLELPYIESDKNILNNFTIDDNSILDMMYNARIYMIDEQDIQSFKNGDKLLMSNLIQNDLKFLQNVKDAYENQTNSSKIILSDYDTEYYKNLNIIQKNRIDRLIAYNLISSDYVYIPDEIKNDSVIIKTIIEKEIVKEYIHDTTYVYSGSSSVNQVEIIFFEFNSTQLTPEATIKLELISNYFKSKPNSSLIINGYTDDSGSVDYNYQLSYDRASVVFKYFINKGITKENIIVNSYGIENPLVPNSNEKLRQLNRRVQILILE
jgi:outer membrane protein OmpA-like peptidoglycan-associated protein